MRVEKAVHELEFQSKFEEVLLNDDLSIALEKAESLVNSFLNK
jgi:guanylate kinase